MTPRATRRAVALGAAAGTLACCALWLHHSEDPSAALTDAEARVAARIARLLDSSHELSGLGKLERWTLRRPLKALLLELFPGDRLAAADRWSDAELEVFLRAETRSDYDAGRITSVGGWLLAATEARICALVFAVGRAISSS
jgi:hypothetical protein